MNDPAQPRDEDDEDDAEEGAEARSRQAEQAHRMNRARAIQKHVSGCALSLLESCPAVIIIAACPNSVTNSGGPVPYFVQVSEGNPLMVRGLAEIFADNVRRGTEEE